ncbi:MAG: hypothetical protein IPK06_09750 [Ignavibacteriae bacterium]|nr:hypothetical protein [Ignavibacteriota bacterium]
MNEKNLQNKLNYVRKDSKYLRINGLEDLAKVLPKRYQDIRLAEEVVNENEVIVEVVTKKYSLGVFNSIDETFTFFVYNNKGEYKIDLDATFTKPDTTMKTMVRKGLKFSKELRAYVTESFMTKEEFQVNNKKVLTSIFDQETREIFVLLKKIYTAN